MIRKSVFLVINSSVLLISLSGCSILSTFHYREKSDVAGYETETKISFKTARM